MCLKSKWSCRGRMENPMNDLVSLAIWMYQRSLTHDPERDARVFARSETRRLKQRRKRARQREKGIKR